MYIEPTIFFEKPNYKHDNEKELEFDAIAIVMMEEANAYYWMNKDAILHPCAN